ncbi:MAG: DUF503 domain-containing protein [Candidatus Omnitrophota bacterium]|nr:MAG: DUF503 domain-containing protein [Candidatus Omnitrophota bacterium]RKY46392.1 MAG: DUF503 domain-containing protein [Candidatus Omnitrophota bacterium]HDN85971.1 DUF503 domain-containing protein [Candidatus Omnitrophota bacterium]
MFIGYLKVDIYIPYCHSLKEKRQIIARIKERLRNKFNVSVAEKPSDKWQRSELSFVCVNYTKSCLDEIMLKIEEYIRFHNDLHILDTQKEIL